MHIVFSVAIFTFYLAIYVMQMSVYITIGKRNISANLGFENTDNNEKKNGEDLGPK